MAQWGTWVRQQGAVNSAASVVGASSLATIIIQCCWNWSLGDFGLNTHSVVTLVRPPPSAQLSSGTVLVRSCGFWLNKAWRSKTIKDAAFSLSCQRRRTRSSELLCAEIVLKWLRQVVVVVVDGVVLNEGGIQGGRCSYWIGKVIKRALQNIVIGLQWDPPMNAKWKLIWIDYELLCGETTIVTAPESNCWLPRRK